MTGSKSHTGRKFHPSDLPEALPEIKLRLGEVLWVLSELGFQGAASGSTFYQYIKSLQNLVASIRREQRDMPHGAHRDYSYDHLMEFALMLTLRVYQVVPDSILVGIVRYRRKLYQHYRRAYAQRCSGMGAPVKVQFRGHPPLYQRGVFLDLQINFSGGILTSFGPPKLTSPFEALESFARRDLAARSLLPINLSRLSEKIVWTTLHAPVIRRGKRPSQPRNRDRLDSTFRL
jgi:hypothetical protein